MHQLKSADSGTLTTEYPSFLIPPEADVQKKWGILIVFLDLFRISYLLGLFIRLFVPLLQGFLDYGP